MADDKVEIQIVLDDGSIAKGFANIEQRAQQASGSIASSLTSGLGGIAKLAAAALGAFSFKKAIDEANQAEQSMVKFSVALANMGKYSTAAVDSFSAFSEQLQSTLGVDSDEILSNAQTLVSVGKLSGDSLERATKAAIDLSKGLGIDLNSAFDLVAKSAAGNAGALGRYGLKIDESLPKSQQFANALGLIEQRFGGMAEQIASNTFQGALDKSSASFGDLFKEIGKFITDSPALRVSIDYLAKGVSAIAESIAKFREGGGIERTFSGLLQISVALAQVFSTYLLPVVEVFVRSFTTGFKTLVFLSNEVLATIASKIFSFFDSVKPLMEKVFGSDFTNSVLGGLETFKESSQAVADEAFADLSASAEKTFNTDISTSVSTFLANYRAALELAKEANRDFKNSIDKDIKSPVMDVATATSAYFGGMDTAATDFSNNAKKNFEQAGKAAFQSLGTGAANAFSAFGKAAAKGENALQAFANSLLSTMGQMAVQLGSQFILQGIAYLWAGMPNGPSLIAAGAALAAFGGILASSSGGSAQASPASAGGGLTSSPSNVTSDLASSESTKPATAVTVNIQGDVLDSDQTGLRIVELMNQAFEKQGAVMVTA